MTKIHKYLDATKLPRRGKYIDWENCVGMELDFIYDNISGKVLIEGYENGVLNISYDNNLLLDRTNFYYANLVNCFKKELLSLSMILGKEL